MDTDKQLTESVFMELGISSPGRLPYAKEIFKVYDIDLLPHASEDTSLCEIFENSGRAFRSTGDNLVGIIAPEDRVTTLYSALQQVVPVQASVPNFQFSKEEIIDFGFKLPFLFNINFTGNVNNAKSLSVKVNSLKKSRISNATQPGIEIRNLLQRFEDENPREYRNRIKHDWIAEALFFAESVDIEFEKDAGVALDVSFEVNNVEVTANVNTATQKKYTLKYTGGHNIPFGATFKKGKELFQ